MQCPELSDLCSTLLLERIGVPSANMSSSSLLKIQMLENRATGYGPNIATDPATLSLTRNMTIHDDLQMEPGQDTFNFLVGLIDALGQPVIGEDYACMLILCSKSAASCEVSVALAAPYYATVDHKNGICQIEAASFVCTSESDIVVAQVSLVSQPAVPLDIEVLCLPCKSGESRSLDSKKQSWLCNKCGPSQYILEPNNPAFGCQVTFLAFEHSPSCTKS